jgi:UDP-N-acetylglucosamine 1-carboxyvinyltransferase
VSCLADGTSYIRETIFDGRYMMAGELNKMGAKIEVTDTAAVVHGPTPLRGTEVTAHDLRTGIGLVLAGLAAEGATIVSPGYPIDRGHASVAARLTALGADITAEAIA